ncbi:MULTISPECIES: hypothetical protein [unclassified Massilia]|uniref:hypothetical protein n=1 Tax=unclassified Massilia TaxID=2609279 RepID=UPI00068C5157|nr:MULTISPECIES: hypothetical protein [unclassified Massilia]ALK99486.2 hypothetical protein AM586_10465 [Massilia sp. WG5]
MQTHEQVNDDSHQHHHSGHADEHQNDYPMVPQRPTREQLSHIKGWGADLDRKNRPAVPMERTPPRFIHAHEGKLPQQPENVEVLVSTERPGITPIFGTAQPPKGLSGVLRRMAFRWSENDMRHWLILLAADRVNVVEGIGEDLARGKVPNVLSEMGIKAEWQHNKAGLVKKAAIASAVVGTALYLMRRRER